MNDSSKDTNVKAAVSVTPPLGVLNLIIVSLISVFFTILLIAAYDNLRYRPIMTVDVEKIMEAKFNAEKKNIMNSSGDFNTEASIRLSQQWAKQLASEVSRLSRDNNAIVLVRPAVVEGGIDMTSQILQAMQFN